MVDRSTEADIARAVSVRLTERGPFAPDDCIMLIGSTVVGFGHARSDLDLLVSGPTPDRVPLHTFHGDRRIDVDFLYPEAWAQTKGRVNACARAVTEPFEGSPPAPVEDRDWWSDHLWLYDRVVHGVPITERTAAEFLDGASTQSLATAIGNYSRALCTRMIQRARMHLRIGTVEAACQYECEALLAAVEAVAADRGLTFWSDRTILEKARRVQRPDDEWDAEHIERLFADLAGRAWGTGPDRSDEVPGVLRALLGAEPADPAGVPAEGGHLEAQLADGWQAHVVAGEGFLLAPDRSLHRVSTSVARFLTDGGRGTALAWPAAAVLVATGALVLEPGGPVRPAVQPVAEPLRLLDVCHGPVAPSPESWLSSRIAAQWNAMTVWSLSDDLRGAVESEQRNRVVPILRKAELFLRMMAMAVQGVRPDAGRSLAMDLQGCVLDEGFRELLDGVYGRPEDFRALPERAVEVFSAAMVAWGMPARPDMFEKSRSFMKQLGDVRMWFRVADAFGIPTQVPDTLVAKGAGSSAPAGSSVFVDAS